MENNGIQQLLLVFIIFWGAVTAASKPSISSSNRSVYKLRTSSGQAGPAQGDVVEDSPCKRQARPQKEMSKPRPSEQVDDTQDDDTETEEDSSPARPGVLVMVEKEFKTKKGRIFRKSVLMEVPYKSALDIMRQHAHEYLYGE
jgi:hypothetical protein